MSVPRDGARLGDGHVGEVRNRDGPVMPGDERQPHRCYDQEADEHQDGSEEIPDHPVGKQPFLLAGRFFACHILAYIQLTKLGKKTGSLPSGRMLRLFLPVFSCIPLSSKNTRPWPSGREN